MFFAPVCDLAEELVELFLLLRLVELSAVVFLLFVLLLRLVELLDVVFLLFVLLFLLLVVCFAPLCLFCVDCLFIFGSPPLRYYYLPLNLKYYAQYVIIV